jgi:hypothetical protein
MALYVVIGTINAPAIKAQIVAQYGANHFEITTNAWLLTDVGTTKDVADKLGMSKADSGALGVVLRCDAYSGRAPATTWTWLQANPGVVANG